jgi:hypothetical protein
VGAGDDVAEVVIEGVAEVVVEEGDVKELEDVVFVFEAVEADIPVPWGGVVNDAQ